MTTTSAATTDFCYYCSTWQLNYSCSSSTPTAIGVATSAITITSVHPACLAATFGATCSSTTAACCTIITVFSTASNLYRNI